MTEKNRDILSKAIHDMEQRSPRATNWDNIAGHLDHLDATAFFSQAGSNLPGHKAPADAWGKVAKGLPPASSSFLGTLTGKIISAFVIVGVIAITIILLPVKEENVIHKPKTNELPVKENEETKIRDHTTVIAKSGQFSEDKDVDDVQVNEKLAGEAVIPAAERQTAEITRMNGRTIEKKPLSSNGSQLLAPSLKTKSYTNTDVSKHLQSPGHQNSVKRTELDPANSVHSGSIKLFRSKKLQLPSGRTYKMRSLPQDYFDREQYKTKYYIGAHYAFIQHRKIKLESMNIPNHLSAYGIDLKMKKRKWFIKTGAEYLNWEETADYFVDFTQNQLVYEYNYVDSAYINPANGQITYYTTERDVYDSIPGQIADESSYQYRILQIPLIIGYEIFEHSKFNISVMGGIGFDIRISGKQFIPAFNKEDAGIDDINNTMQYRTNNNWRLIMGAEFTYRITDDWELFIEPTYQQYLRPLYTIGETKGIGLFKLKTGINFSF